MFTLPISGLSTDCLYPGKDNGKNIYKGVVVNEDGSQLKNGFIRLICKKILGPDISSMVMLDKDGTFYMEVDKFTYEGPLYLEVVKYSKHMELVVAKIDLDIKRKTSCLDLGKIIMSLNNHANKSENSAWTHTQIIHLRNSSTPDLQSS